MPINSLFGKTFHAIERSLDITKKRHGLLTSNIANLDTPNYRAKDIDFKDALKDALDGISIDLSRTDSHHFGSKTFYAEPSLSESGSVDIDIEMSKLAENNLRYRMSVEVLLRKLSMLKQAIIEGGR
ncbi:MAG: flagellar basal body rod protein FlgB [Deltaproteobacteria bacterium]|nr:flagellar basal body rod protein FlgB [Deltaproteobacteria bacterium]MBW2018948.1 flagellar basal body rod protein FlgB [Deltaproteobacteria bacterium]MBW2073163.1 flagellar basal body rod protein FlgB [Deltaproteobacteria bacterium]RLB83783.1 MAG: flagellar basal body rod protein FlgB [Deltaproteobacteria bacterium]